MRPLYYAVSSESSKSDAIMIEVGAWSNVRNINGETLLPIAAETKNAAAVQILIQM
jgi:hypothetical protein